MMVKKSQPREMTAAEKTVLSKKTNECLDHEIQVDYHQGIVAPLKKEIRAMLEAAGLAEWPTDRAFARLDTKANRKFDEDAVEDIRRMVDPADFETICPRRVDLKAFDEIIGHHRYPKLEGVPKVGTSTSLTVGQLAG